MQGAQVQRPRGLTHALRRAGHMPASSHGASMHRECTVCREEEERDRPARVPEFSNRSFAGARSARAPGDACGHQRDLEDHARPSSDQQA
eukprot:6037786-Pyramimonas_sp.AAC.1